MNDRIPVIVCIDVEPDPQRPDPKKADPWRGFERLYPYLQEYRLRVADTTGRKARLNWFWRVDPQIEIVYGSAQWALRQYHAEVGETVQVGDEHGVHPHAWRWDVALGGWVSDYGNPSWLEHCLSISFKAFDSVFGRACESVRLGNRYFDDRVRGTLENLGCLFDLTIEPGERPEPELPQDYQSMTMGPYRPSVEDFRKPDTVRLEGLWSIPLAAGVMSEQGLAWRRYLRKYVSSSGPIPTGYGTLRLWEPPELVQPAVEEILQKLERPYLAFAIRSDVLQNPWWGRNCRRNLEGLLKQKKARQFLFCTPRDLLRTLGLPVKQTAAKIVDRNLQVPLGHPPQAMAEG